MRVGPILTLGLMAGVLMLSDSALALGLGKLTVLSSLGQPLSARIELTSATKEELDSLAAKVADPSLYRQNNLAYQGVLARSRVTLERGPSGQAALIVTTQGALNEPYLDLMVELNWASGRLVREYTFLLDPPGAPAPPVEPVAPVRSGVAPPRAAPVAPAPAAAAPAAQAPAPAAQAPAPAAVPSATAPRGTGEGDSYTVKRGDTLSKIAAEHKPQNVSLEQMLVAIFKNNQSAFDANNINRLRSGSIITIPSAADAASTPPPDASKVVKMHSADWRAYRDRVAASAPVSEAAGTRASAGKIGTTVEETTPAAAPGRDQLKVSRAPESGKGTGTGAGAAAEEAVTRDRQIKEAQQRIADLEKTVKDLQRAAELKSQALAMLQAQADATKGQPPKSATTPSTPEQRVAEPASVAPAKSADASKMAEPAKAPETAKSPEPAKALEPAKIAEPAKVAEPAPLPPAVKPEDASRTPAKGAARPEETAKAAKAAKVEPTPKPASFFDDLMSNTPTWAIGAGALAVLAGIAALLAARRRKTAYEEAIAPDTDLKTNTVFGSTGGGVVNTGDNSLVSEFSQKGLGNIDTDEVDPIAEAEVYLAYGRDAQAEEILKDALKKDPQRQEIYLKLLEIHAQHNKPSAFESVASELYSVSHGQGEVWQKAATLGRQLDPNNPMFAAAGDAAIGAGMAAAGDAHTFSVPPDLSPPASSAPSHVAGNDNDNIFDRHLDEDIARSSGAHTKSPSDILAGAESELEKTARNAPATSGGFGRTAAAAATAALVSGIAKGKSADLRDAERAAPDGGPRALGSDLDFHLDESEKPVPLRGASAAPAAGANTGAKSADSTEFDKLDFEFNDDRSTFEDATPSVLDGQWHDSATKLDLAKAYQEMGDVEGAREILREVLAEGDSEQKTEAQALIAKLP